MFLTRHDHRPHRINARSHACVQESVSEDNRSHSQEQREGRLGHKTDCVRQNERRTHHQRCYCLPRLQVRGVRPPKQMNGQRNRYAKAKAQKHHGQKATITLDRVRLQRKSPNSTSRVEQHRRYSDTGSRFTFGRKRIQRAGPRRHGEPGRNRTCDPRIKSALLYQLSYGPHILLIYHREKPRLMLRGHVSDGAIWRLARPS
jgi:hypothetical protein